jgi:hypothetical protein
MTVLYTELSPDFRQKCHMVREGIQINVHGKPKRESNTIPVKSFFIRGRNRREEAGSIIADRSSEGQRLLF